MNNQCLVNPSRQAGYNKSGHLYEQDRYGSAHMQLYLKTRSQAVADVIHSEFNGAEPLAVLEVACGTGLTLANLSEVAPRHDLTGIDFSETMLDQAREKAASSTNPPTLIQASAFELPFEDSSFDLVYSTRFIHQFSHEHKKRLYSEMLRVARPNASIVIEFYARPFHAVRYFFGGKKARSWQSYSSHYPSFSQLKDIVGPTFTLVPLRIAGARLFHAIGGERLSRWLTSATRSLPLSVLRDEYFVITRK